MGIILHYNTDEENSVNIEFHDTATHHAMHVANTLEHTMADLSSEVVVLANGGDEDSPRCDFTLLFQKLRKLWFLKTPEKSECLSFLSNQIFLRCYPYVLYTMFY